MRHSASIHDYPHSPGFPFVIGHADLTMDRFPVHGHEVMELVIVLGGRATHVTEHEQYPLGAGDVFVIHQRRAHGFERLEGLRLWNIMFDRRLLQGGESYLQMIPGYHVLFRLEPTYRKSHGFRSRLRLRPPELNRAAELAAQIHAEHTTRADGHQAVILGLFWQLVAYLARRYSSVGTAEGKALLRMGKAISYLEKNYTRPVSLRELSAQVHLSVNQTLRVFREATGESPLNYLLQYRIRRACELLRQTPLKITTIALQVGFSDGNYFARQFRKITGKTPRQYREA